MPMKGWRLRKGARDSLKVAATVWSQPHLGTIDETELSDRQQSSLYSRHHLVT